MSTHRGEILHSEILVSSSNVIKQEDAQCRTDSQSENTSFAPTRDCLVTLYIFQHRINSALGALACHPAQVDQVEQIVSEALQELRRELQDIDRHTNDLQVFCKIAEKDNTIIHADLTRVSSLLRTAQEELLTRRNKYAASIVENAALQERIREALLGQEHLRTIISEKNGRILRLQQHLGTMARELVVRSSFAMAAYAHAHASPVLSATTPAAVNAVNAANVVNASTSTGAGTLRHDAIMAPSSSSAVAPSSSATSFSSSSSSDLPTDPAPGATLCTICYDNQPTILFQPCCHVITCLPCAGRYLQATSEAIRAPEGLTTTGEVRCPKCRSPVLEARHVFW